jgi:hypothetical protein
MLKVILFELSPVCGKPVAVSEARRVKQGGNLRLVVEKVMGHVVADIAKYSSAVHCGRRIPIVEEHNVGKSPKWSCEDQE